MTTVPPVPFVLPREARNWRKAANASVVTCAGSRSRVLHRVGAYHLKMGRTAGSPSAARMWKPLAMSEMTPIPIAPPPIWNM